MRISDWSSDVCSSDLTTGRHRGHTRRRRRPNLVLGETTTMAFVKRKTLFILVGLSVIAVLAVAGFIWSGLYNIGADDPHTGPVYSASKPFAKARTGFGPKSLRVRIWMTKPGLVKAPRSGKDNFETQAT